MMRLGKSELYFKRWISLDELAEQIEAVSREDVLEFSQEFFQPDQYSEARLLPAS
jgi:predicted Zn-dependent peptidase